MRHSTITLIASALFGCLQAISANAPDNNSTPNVSNISMLHHDNYLFVNLTMKLDDIHVSSNRAVLLTPQLINHNDTLNLPSVGIYGRQRYYVYVRNGKSMLSGEDELSYKASQAPDTLRYSTIQPYQEWMNGATLSLRRSEYGCCRKLLATDATSVSTYSEAFFPQLVYVVPQAEATKSRTLAGEAFIDFPVNETTINPTYRSNASELGKIHATIDSIRNDADITITSLWLKGYASPEATYEHNQQLAMERTDALKTYINALYDVPADIITTDYEAEDWAGLRQFVDKSNLEHRAEILTIIDGTLEFDSKEWAIKSRYPNDYQLLLSQCYPALRHTDYRIAYNIRSYQDVTEIERIMHSQPQKLSLNEFYVVAQAYEPGSDQFTEVFETAVRMYPTDATANLNAANAAIRRDDYVNAERYLARAGNTPEAAYAHGALAIRRGDFQSALYWLNEARDLGIAQAQITIDQLPSNVR